MFAERGDTETRAAAADEWCALLRESERALSPLQGIEDGFFTELGGFLADSQIEMLQVVRMRCERLRSLDVGSPFPGLAFDLDWALLELARAGHDVTPKHSG